MSAKQLPKLKKRQLSSKQQKLSNFSSGARGESQAQKFLLQLGYHILDTNCRFKLHEVDIVALDPQFNEVVFVEVKTRSSTEFGEPSRAVNNRKIRSLVKVAQIYLKEKKLDNLDYRFDVITVLPNKVNHYPNVTWEMIK